MSQFCSAMSHSFLALLLLRSQVLRPSRQPRQSEARNYNVSPCPGPSYIPASCICASPAATGQFQDCSRVNSSVVVYWHNIHMRSRVSCSSLSMSAAPSRHVSRNVCDIKGDTTGPIYQVHVSILFRFPLGFNCSCLKTAKLSCAFENEWLHM